jgi:hypothetical protein
MRNRRTTRWLVGGARFIPRSFLYLFSRPHVIDPGPTRSAHAWTTPLRLSLPPPPSPPVPQRRPVVPPETRLESPPARAISGPDFRRAVGTNRLAALSLSPPPSRYPFTRQSPVAARGFCLLLFICIPEICGDTGISPA